jgi:HEAT repeat protein
MKRLMCVAAGVVLFPFSAFGQGAPPAPPSPPAAPAPAARPASPAPAAPARPAPLPTPRALPELDRLEDGLLLGLDQRLAIDEARRLSADQQREMGREVREIARQAREMARQQLIDVDLLGNIDVQIPNLPNLDQIIGDSLGRFDFNLQGPVIAGRRGDEAGLYNNGLNALQRRQYDRAIELFDRVLAQKGTHADGAAYWKAFSQARLARGEDALATLAALRRDFPQSRYSAEAKVLETDVRNMAGQRLDPQTLDANDEIKLIAINGIANTDPERAIPLLEGVLNASNTLGIKRRALFVLALSNDPRAHQILLRYAKGAGNPELQVEAIRHLVSRRDSQTTAGELREIYQSTDDAAIRRAVIDAYRSAGDKTALLAIAKSKAEAGDVRRFAIASFANLGEPSELLPLYQEETDPELRMQIVNVLASRHAVDALSEIARTEKDPAVRVRALRGLGNQPVEQTGELLVSLYGANEDAAARRAIIGALRSQNNAEGLVSIARKESSLELKREIVSALSGMAPKNKAAADYLMEVIK